MLSCLPASTVRISPRIVLCFLIQRSCVSGIVMTGTTGSPCWRRAAEHARRQHGAAIHEEEGAMTTTHAPSETRQRTRLGAKPLASVPFTQVQIDDAFWAPRQRTNRERTIPHIYEQLRKTGRLEALTGMWDPDVVRRGPQ